MDNRNTRDRNRNDNDRRDTYDTRQAEQFEDSAGYGQDDSWSQSSRNFGDRDRPVGMYYEEVVVRSPRRDRDDGRNWQTDRGNDRLSGSDSYYRSDRNSGGQRNDNGLGYFTSESQRGRDFSRDRSQYGGQTDYGTRGDYSDRGGYRNDDRYRNNDRGFMERAGDEIASWFGDEDAARRRRMDHRGSGPANYTRSDERILEDACDRLTEDWDLDARNIQVTVNGGEVTLDGTVDDRGSKRRAEDIVHDLSGVGHVQNNLRIQNAASMRTDTVSES